MRRKKELQEEEESRMTNTLTVTTMTKDTLERGVTNEKDKNKMDDGIAGGFVSRSGTDGSAILGC